MRRRAGVGAIQKHRLQQDRFKEKGSEIQENQLEQMVQQMEKFRSNLEDYAAKHKNEIRKNPQFRRQFQEMCASIGVDPLASGKGFWSELLGVGDLYYELGVQVVELCVATAHLNGGMLPLADAIKRLNARGARKSNPIAEDDIVRAIKKLRVLGSGVEILVLGRAQYISAIPGELTMDHGTLLKAAEKRSEEGGRGQVTVAWAADALGWEEQRALRAIEQLLRAGVAWKDDVDDSYWFPAMFQNACS